MNPIIELELNIEELERKIAPTGVETVLPLSPGAIEVDPVVIDTNYLIPRG